MEEVTNYIRYHLASSRKCMSCSVSKDKDIFVIKICLVQELPSERALSAKLPIQVIDTNYKPQWRLGCSSSKSLEIEFYLLYQLELSKTSVLASAPYLTFYCEALGERSQETAPEFRGIWIRRFTYGNCGLRCERFSKIL